MPENSITNEALCAAIQTGDDTAIERLLQRNEGFVQWLIPVFFRNYEVEKVLGNAIEGELAQACRLAMIKAAKSYLPDKGTTFLTYARRIMLREMLSVVAKERAASPIALLDREKATCVLPLDACYDEDSDTPLIQQLPDENIPSPEERFIQKEDSYALRQVLQALPPREREYLSLRYSLQANAVGQPVWEAVLTRRDAAKQAHISEARAKRLEEQALKRLGQTLQAHNHATASKQSALSAEAQSIAEALCQKLRQSMETGGVRVRNIPFCASAAGEREIILGTADITAMAKSTAAGEKADTSAYLPVWTITAESADAIDARIHFPTRQGQAAFIHMCLQVETISTTTADTGAKSDASDLAELLWGMVDALWDEPPKSQEAVGNTYARRCFIRDICTAILDRHRRLGGWC